VNTRIAFATLDIRVRTEQRALPVSLENTRFRTARYRAAAAYRIRIHLLQQLLHPRASAILDLQDTTGDLALHVCQTPLKV
jgi:hypothetical protein